MTNAMIEQRLNETEPWAPNYFGHVPSDWQEIVENLLMPTLQDIKRILAMDPKYALDNAIRDAYFAMLPAGYDGVAVDIRSRFGY